MAKNGQYRRNSAYMTRPILPIQTWQTCFNRQFKYKVKLINKIVINQVISYWRCYGSSVCYIGRPRTRKWANTNNNITLLLDYHRRRKVKNIGGGGGQGLEYWGREGRGGGGQGGGAISQQAHDVVLTSMRRNNVASTSVRRHVPTRFLINQCQIITFLILKSDNIDNIENSRIDLKGIILQVPSNQI